MSEPEPKPDGEPEITLPVFHKAVERECDVPDDVEEIKELPELDGSCEAEIFIVEPPVQDLIFDGHDGRDGCDGLDGIDGVDGIDGQDGRDGIGLDGCAGIDGRETTEGTDAQDGRDGIANIFEGFLTQPYFPYDESAEVDGVTMIVPPALSERYSLLPDWIPAGTPVRFYPDLLTGAYTVLDVGHPDPGGEGTGTGDGSGISVGGSLYCEIIEPIRCPPFYNSQITPNPLAVTGDGFFLQKDIEASENGYRAFMSMGLVKVSGKEYTPLQATYTGNEFYVISGMPYRRRVGDLRYDATDRPLYLMRRELKTADNNCVLRRGEDTSYPFKWQYANGDDFSSGTNDDIWFSVNEAIADYGTYNRFLYAANETIRNSHGELANDDVKSEKDIRDYDYLEMKPYYFRSSVALGGQGEEKEEGDGEPEWNEDGYWEIEEEESEMDARECRGISPQWWKLTTDPLQAQLNYDLAYCSDLEWAETLVPGEKVRCVRKRKQMKVQAIDEYGNPRYEPIYDQYGVLVGYSDERAYETKIFEYYELAPPPRYKEAISGQPAVTLYVGTPERVLMTEDISSGKEDSDADTLLTSLKKTSGYVRPEDIVSPDYELVYATLGAKKSSADRVNPLAVVNDLQTDRLGTPTNRLRALFYKRDSAGRLYPTLFEVEMLPYGYCIEVGNIQNYYATDKDKCSPHYLAEEYEIVRRNRNRGQIGKTLQLASTKCFKHRLQSPVLPKKKVT